MQQMFKKSAIQAITFAALFISCFVPGSAFSKENLPSSISLNNTKSKLFNLKAHEGRFRAHYKMMTKKGKVNEISQEFVEVHDGMKKGKYKFDLATAQKVIREVYASRMPGAPAGLREKIETEIQN